MKVLGFVSLLLIQSCAHAVTTPEERIRDYFESELHTKRKGAIVGIFDQGKTTFLSFGGVPEDGILEIASLTKTFTALLYSLAIDRGLLTPETTLSEIRTEWKNEKLGRIRLMDLATHRSGLPRMPCDFFYKDPANPYADYTEENLIASIRDHMLAKYPECKMTSGPTSEIQYSNWGMAILGHAVSIRAKQSFAELLRNWITVPLGMKDTVITLTPEQKSRLVQGYTEQLKPTGLWERAGMWGNGAIKSTASDIMIYARAMVRPDETPFASSIRRVQERQHANMGLGWFLSPSGSIWHDGMTGGYAVMFKAYQKKDYAVFALSNTATYLSCFIEAFEDISCQP